MKSLRWSCQLSKQIKSCELFFRADPEKANKLHMEMMSESLAPAEEGMERMLKRLEDDGQLKPTAIIWMQKLSSLRIKKAELKDTIRDMNCQLANLEAEEEMFKKVKQAALSRIARRASDLR